MARVLLVGFEDQDNLGLRYLSSALRQAGHTPRLARYRRGSGGHALQVAAEFAPDLVGVSLIFQFLAPEFGQWMAALRRQGFQGHLTLGGHFASFEPGRVLDAFPELDSVVRYEGEDALCALAGRLDEGHDWRDLEGMAFRAEGGGVITTAARAGREDLDTLPWPDRADIDYRQGDLPTASMLGSRGCAWVCSFCSIITFYADNGTRGRRLRDPVRVVDEMEHLHHERGARLILWQDDDFLAGGPRSRRWARELAAETIRRGLHRTLRWKMSCRSDEVSLESLAPLRDAGLTHVYMGVEAGDEEDLKAMNKQLHPDRHLEAGEVLRHLGLSFDFGFMLMNPWSSLRSVRANVAFLRSFVGDGAAVAGFCRMLPYAGTPVEARLRREGRLRERDFDVDYDFLDPRLDVLYDWSLRAFTPRNHERDGTWNLLRVLALEAALDLPDRPRDLAHRASLHRWIAVSNELMCAAVERALEIIEGEGVGRAEDPRLEALRLSHEYEDGRIRAELLRLAASRPATLKFLLAA